MNNALFNKDSSGPVPVAQCRGGTDNQRARAVSSHSIAFASFEMLEPRQFMSVGHHHHAAPRTPAPSPTATFLQYITGSGASRTFSILYDSSTTSAGGIDRATVVGSDVRVFGPDGFAESATFTGATRYKPGNGMTARYRINGIKGGLYKIALLSNAVGDAFGNVVAPVTLGGFRVGSKGRTVPISSTYQPLAPSVQVVATTYGPSFAPPPIDTSFGTVVGAFNFGGTPYDLLGSTGVNVHFDSVTASSLSAGPVPAGTSPLLIQMSTGIPNDLFDASVGADPVYQSEIYSATWSTTSLKISGLDPARRYRFQFLHGDTRSSTYAYVSTPQMFELPTGQATNAPLAFNTTTIDADANMAVVVGGTTALTYRMPLCPTRGPSFSGMVIEAEDTLVPPQPPPAPPATLVRSSIRLTGSSQTFDIAYGAPPAGRETAPLALSNVLITSVGGFAAQASLVGINAATNVATYRIDGIAATGRYTISINDQSLGDLTLFNLRPQRWE
jgi:hypothetical protein